jgi:translocation and assembly module TamB
MQTWIISLRKVLGWLAIVLVIGFVTLIPATYLWLQSSWGKSWIATKIQDSYNNQLKSNLHIGSIEGRLPIRFILNDVMVSLEVDPSRVDTIARIGRVELSLRFWDLLYGQIQLTGLKIQDPFIRFEILPDSTLNLARAFEPKMPSGIPSKVFLPENLDIYAPLISVHNGTILFGNQIAGRTWGKIILPASVDSVEARFFVELNQEQRFVDIVTLSARSRDNWIERVEISGQLFSDARFTELKRFKLQTDKSMVMADITLEGPDINKKEWSDSLDTAQLKFSIKDTRIHPDDASPWTQKFPGLRNAAEIELEGRGTISELDLDFLEIMHNESHLVMSGNVKNVLSDVPITFSADVTTLKADFNDLTVFLPDVDTEVVRAISETQLRGLATGTLDSVSVDMVARSPAGDLAVVGGLNWTDAKSYRATLSSSDLNLGAWSTLKIADTRLNISTFIEGNGFDKSANLAMISTLLGSRVRGIGVDTLRVVAGLNKSELTSRILLVSEAGRVTANGNAILFVNKPEYHLTGTVAGLNMASFRSDSLFPDTDLTAEFSLDLFGAGINDLYGRISLDGMESTVAGRLYPPIQAYADLSETTGRSRSFRLTSSFLDAVVTGNLIPQNIQRQFDYWVNEIKHQVEDEILRAENTSLRTWVREPSESVSLQYNLSIKQIQTLRRLLPRLPDFETSARIEGTVLADRERMLLDVSVVDDSVRVDDIMASNVNLRLTMALQHGQELGESGNVQMVSSLGSLQIGQFNLENIQTRASLLNDTIFVAQTIAAIGEGARSSYTIQASLRDTSISVEFPTFFLGNNQYSWRASGIPQLFILPGKKIDFADFKFENANQSLMLKGIYSEDPADMLVLDLVDVDLKSISDLVKVRFDFEGVVNGLLQTRSLRTQTNIEGHLEIDAFAINDRVVGDIKLDSEYNPSLRRFDTIINVKTDSLKYAEYFDRNNGIGQDIELVGYLAPRNLNPDLDHLFNFDVTLNEVDLWVIRFLLLDVFTKVEGKATGFGNIRGDAGNIVYDASFTLEDAEVTPIFLNTNYVLNGDITFRNEDGLVFNNVRVNDDKRGTGVLSGSVDMNDFQPEKYLDLRLRLNRLEFLNNSYNPDVPFYGRVSGSGDIRLFGPTNKIFLQTLRPITVTPNSKLILPLLDEGNINQQTNFIKFVNEFFEKNIPIQDRPTADGVAVTPQARNFFDVFQLDLQFNMPQDAAIEFIFDPVTNEYLTTRGTGSVRITLESGNLGMFGTFDIDRGEYNFVGGDIFSKKFKIRQGGQVIWDGLAQDPRIEVTAFFTARPNLSPLGTGRDVRVPIDLILSLNGRMGSLENEFYFAYPASNFDQSLTAAELSILNGEDQKLLQATSLLITGNFLPVNTGGQTDVNIQNKMTQAGIGQLLSSQINYLLNSSLSNFDFDLNLTGFDQADLGIGLRLFDDRLELRRDGTIVGDQTNIGDLAATYRINRFFSVEIFHRQDINSTRGLSQEGTVDRVNGIGLQYQVEFSTWKKFLSDIWRALSGTGS